jgi:hypothetical protein
LKGHKKLVLKGDIKIEKYNKNRKKKDKNRTPKTKEENKNKELN